MWGCLTTMQLNGPKRLAVGKACKAIFLPVAKLWILSRGGGGCFISASVVSTPPQDEWIHCVTIMARAQELCESRGGRPGLPSLINLQFLWFLWT